jgi:hypothetical protein
MSNRLIYLRVCIVEEIPTRKRDEIVEETVDGFEIEFSDLREARQVLREVSDELDKHKQLDLMDEGDEEDDGGDQDDEDTQQQVLDSISNHVKTVIRKKFR